MIQLPHWVLTDSFPAFYDTESKTALEQTARVYAAMQNLITEYNEFVDKINTEIKNFEDGSRTDFDVFTKDLRQEFQDFIDVINLKYLNQNNILNNAVDYMKTNLSSSISELLEESRNNGTLDNDILRVFRDITNQIQTLNSRMNTFTSLKEGSTTGDAELTDARIDFNGTIHENVGAHIRTVTSKQNETIHQSNASTSFLIGNFVNGDWISGAYRSDIVKRVCSEGLISYPYDVIIESTVDYVFSINNADGELVAERVQYAEVTGNTNFYLTIYHIYNDENNSYIANIEEYKNGVTVRSITQYKTMLCLSEYENNLFHRQCYSLASVNVGSLQALCNPPDFTDDTSCYGLSYLIPLKYGKTLKVNTPEIDGTYIKYRYGMFDADGVSLGQIISTSDSTFTHSDSNGAFVSVGVYYYDDVDCIIPHYNILNDFADEYPIILEIEGYTTSERIECNNTVIRKESKVLYDTLEEHLSECNPNLELAKNETYASLFNGSGEVEPFLFFTDPHYVFASENGGYRTGYENHLDIIKKHYDNSNAAFVLCGGDWLNNSNTISNACYELSKIKGKMRSLFDKYHLVLGNHDTNYQGKTVSGGEASTGQLEQQTIYNLWYGEYGKSYYSFEGANTKFYIFDCGLDWNHFGSLNDFDNEQIEFFIKELNKNDDTHIALAPHMIYIDGDSLHPLTDKITEISNAYNNRSTVEYNGVTYDFGEKTGMVEFMIAGHMHADSVGTLNNIPYIQTINADISTDYPSFDLVFVDYTKRKLKTVRIGSGEDREIELIN